MTAATSRELFAAADVCGAECRALAAKISQVVGISPLPKELLNDLLALQVEAGMRWDVALKALLEALAKP